MAIIKWHTNVVEIMTYNVVDETPGGPWHQPRSIPTSLELNVTPGGPNHGCRKPRTVLAVQLGASPDQSSHGVHLRLQGGGNERRYPAR